MTAVVIHEHTSTVVGKDGTTYGVRILGEARADGTWWGWLEFHPRESGRAVLRTDQETSQPNRDALSYWAKGLEPVYLEGALVRAQDRAAGD